MTKAEIQEICKQYNVVYLQENESAYRCDTLWLNNTWIGDIDYFNNEYSVYDYANSRFISTKNLLHKLLADKVMMFKKFYEMKRIQKMGVDFD